MIPVGDTLKEAWTLTWRYRLLWLFAFLYAGGTNLRINEQRGPGESVTAMERTFQSFFSAQPGLTIALIALAVLLGIAWFIVGIAANGGLLWLTREAAYRRTLSGPEGFRFGFRMWGRTFLFGLMIVGIAVLVALVVVALVFIPILGWIADAVIVVALVVLGAPLLGFGLRFALLADMVPSAALGASTRLLKARWREILPFALAMIGIAMAFAALAGALSFPALFVARRMLDGGQLGPAVGVLTVAWLVLLMPTVWHTTFSETAWTLAFERVAREPLVSQLMPADPAADTPAPGSIPTPPPAPPAAPPAPPAAPPVRSVPPAPEPPAPDA